MAQADFSPQQVLDFWFPDTGHENDVASHGAFWQERMQGGMDAKIIAEFGDLTVAAATGLLDHWAETPRGRLALLIALDQFPRSLWRDTPAAFAQDIKAARLALQGIENGDFDELAPWEQQFFIISISHCEGPDHVQRMERIAGCCAQIIDNMPECLTQMREMILGQNQRVLSIIKTFGRHPHRNAVLGRPSTQAEAAYIATGDFPHILKPQDTAKG